METQRLRQSVSRRWRYTHSICATGSSPVSTARDISLIVSRPPSSRLVYTS
jgi:hypothetical protein